ncbi:hypothetical protein ABIE89_005774 [Bradyrhizobium niftali]
MSFVLVNHEPSLHEASCSACAGHLRAGYVRNVPTRACYCNYDCYRRHRLSSALTPWPLVHLSAVAAPGSVTASRQIAMETIIVSGAIAHWSLIAQMWTLSYSLTRAFLSAHELMTWKAGNS